MTDKCEDCQGSGRVPSSDKIFGPVKVCKSCKGKGEIDE